jgi:hypothetical protein
MATAISFFLLPQETATELRKTHSHCDRMSTLLTKFVIAYSALPFLTNPEPLRKHYLSNNQ